MYAPLPGSVTPRFLHRQVTHPWLSYASLRKQHDMNESNRAIIVCFFRVFYRYSVDIDGTHRHKADIIIWS